MQRAMKDSGIEWIGKTPADWTVVPLKRVASFSKGLPITKDDLTEHGVPVVSYGQIHSKANSGTHLQDDLIRFVSETHFESNPSSLGRKGDIFFADTSEDYVGIGNAVLVDRDTPVFAGYHTIIVRPEKQSYSRYLAYLFLTDTWRSQLCSRASGIKVFSITQGLLKKTTVILPPVENVAAMTDYLDRKCGQIDAIIARQQEVIEKLKAYKRSVITEAVTKGLNPNVPMKESGIEWIGKIPADWEIRKIKQLADSNMKNSFVDGDWIESPYIVDSGIRYLTTGNIGDGVFKEQGNGYITLKTFVELACKYAFPGDLIISRLNAPYGRSCILPSDHTEYVVAVDNVILRTQEDKRYICYVSQCDGYKHTVEDDAKGSTMKRISRTNLGNIVMPLPPMQQQRCIADYLDRKCKRIDATVTRKQALIEKLKAYKKSLIYEVVTGKKEV